MLGLFFFVQSIFGDRNNSFSVFNKNNSYAINDIDSLKSNVKRYYLAPIIFCQVLAI